MSFRFAAVVNDAALLKTALGPYHSVLSATESDHTRLGLGYYQSGHAGEPLFAKYPKLATPAPCVMTHLQGLKAHIVLGESGYSTEQLLNDADIPPFRFQRWIGCCVVQAPTFPLSEMDELTRSLRISGHAGKYVASAGLAGAYFAKFLVSAVVPGMDETFASPRVTAERLRDAHHEFVTNLGSRGHSSDVSLSCIVTNGTHVFAIHHQQWIGINRQQSFQNVGIDSNGKAFGYPHLRSAMLIAKQTPISEPGWESTPSDVAVYIDTSLNIQNL